MGNGMNKVLPGLYVGNFRDSKDPEQLKTHNITHILSIHDNARKLPCNSDKEYLCIVASDSPGQNLTQYFPACNDFIHTARLKGGGVLIHCLAGMSRSVTVAVVYVMCVTSLSWRDSLKAVRGARNVANPNVGFLKQLQDFDSERLNDERRRLRAKFHNVTLEDEDEQMAKQLLASYYHSMSLGEMCEGNCPPGVACPRGLCHPPRRAGIFRRNSRDSTGSRSSSPSRHRSSSPSRGPNSPGSSPVSPRRCSPTPPSPLVRRPSHNSRSSSPQLTPPQSMSPSTNRRSSSPLSSPRHGSAPTSPNHSTSPVRSKSSSPLNSPMHGSPLPSPKHTFTPIFGTRHSYTSPPGSPKRCGSPVSSRRNTSPFPSPKRYSSAPNSPQHSTNSSSAYSPKNILRKCSLWSHSSKNNSQENKSLKNNSNHQTIDNDTDSQHNKREHLTKQSNVQDYAKQNTLQITKQTSLPLQPTQQLSPTHQIQRQNSLPQQHTQQLSPQYHPSSVGPYFHIYRQSSLPEEETEESLQIHVLPFNSPQHQRYRWVTCHLPTNDDLQSQENEKPSCPYNELFRQASLQESRYTTKPSQQTNDNISQSNVNNMNTSNTSDEKRNKMLSRQSSLDNEINRTNSSMRHLTRQTSLPEKPTYGNVNTQQRRPPPPPIPENSKAISSRNPFTRQNSFQNKAANNNMSPPPALHVPIQQRIPPPLPPNKPQYVPNGSTSTQVKRVDNVNQESTAIKINQITESPVKTHQSAPLKQEQKLETQLKSDRTSETQLKQKNPLESPVKKQVASDLSSKWEKVSDDPSKLVTSQPPLTKTSKPGPSAKHDRCSDSHKAQVNSPSGSPVRKQQTNQESSRSHPKGTEAPQVTRKCPETPLKSEKRAESPLKSEKRPESPIKSAKPESLRSEKRPDSPLKSEEKRPESPLKSGKRPESPLKLEKRPESPLKSEKRPESPLKSGKKPESPLKSEKSSKTPLKSEKKLESSIKSEKRPDSPLKSEKRPASPLRIEKRPESPLKSEKRPESPLKSERRPESPLTQSTPGSPIRKQVKPNSQSKQEGMPQSSLKQESPHGSPIKKQVKSESSIKQGKQPELPTDKEIKVGSPTTKSTTSAAKQEQRVGHPVPLVKKDSKTGLPLNEDRIAESSGPKAPSHTVPQHQQQQQQQSVSASSSGKPNTNSLPRTNSSQSSSYRPPCPPRKHVPPVEKAPNSSQTLTQQSDLSGHAQHQKKLLTQNPQQHQVNSSQSTIPSQQQQLKSSAQAQQVHSKSSPPIRQQQSKALATADDQHAKQPPHVSKQQQEQQVFIQQQAKQGQLQQQASQNSSQQLLQEQQKSKLIVSVAVKSTQKGLDSPQSVKLSVVPASDLSRQSQSAKPLMPPQKPPPRHLTSSSAVGKSAPIQQQPRPVPPQLQSPRPSLPASAQSQPSSCPPCLPIQPRPTPLHQMQTNGSTKTVLNEVAAQLPSSTIPPKATNDSHPDPLPKQCPSSLASAGYPDTPPMKVNSSLESGHSKTSSITSTSASSSSSSSITCPPELSDTTKHFQTNTAANTPEPSKISHTRDINPSKCTQKTVGYGKVVVVDDAPLTPHKAKNAQSKSSTNTGQGQGEPLPMHEIFKTCTVKSSQKGSSCPAQSSQKGSCPAQSSQKGSCPAQSSQKGSCPAPPSLPTSPRPTLANKQKSNTSTNTKTPTNH